MKPVTASDADIKMWGRALRSFQGAYGSGHPFAEAQIAGHLFAAIPISNAVTAGLWELIGLSKDHPDSAWKLIPRYDEFALCMRGQRFKQGFFDKGTWYCEFGFQFGKAEQAIRGIYFTKSLDMIDLFDHAQTFLNGEKPLRSEAPRY